MVTEIKVERHNRLHFDVSFIRSGDSFFDNTEERQFRCWLVGKTQFCTSHHHMIGTTFSFCLRDEKYLDEVERLLTLMRIGGTLALDLI